MKYIFPLLLMAAFAFAGHAQAVPVALAEIILKAENQKEVNQICASSGFKVTESPEENIDMVCIDEDCMGPVIEVKYTPTSRTVGGITIYGLRDKKSAMKELKHKKYKKTGNAKMHLVEGPEVKAEVFTHDGITCYVCQEPDMLRLIYTR